jgi:mono/diheme cytochrome c family protein
MEEGNAESRRWIETRFLTKQDGEWFGYSYLWNDEQTDAKLVDKDGVDRKFQIRAADGTTREQTWRFPSRTECMVCHSRAAKFVLGLSSLQLNRTFEYSGVTANQLEVLEWLGLLRVNWSAELHAALREELKSAGLSDSEVDRRVQEITATRGQRSAPTSSLLFQSPHRYQRLVDPYDPHADLTARARSYLHANCAQCHVEAGGGNAQMQLEFATPLEKTNLVDVTPLHHTFEIADARLIAPGAPQRSVLLHRIAIRDRGQMPQLATSLIDPQAVELLRTWIASLKPAP